MAAKSVGMARHVHLDHDQGEKGRLECYDVRIHPLMSGRDVVTVPITVKNKVALIHFRPMTHCVTVA